MFTESTVFIVDDDPAARDSVAALIQSKGVPTQSFATAEEFLGVVESEQTGCLIADVRMTGMSGLELQDVMRAKNIALPVILITGYGDVAGAVRAMKAGAFTFLEKPCRARELWSSVQNALLESVTLSREKHRISEIRSRINLLTPEEQRILRMMFVGKTNKAIASELDIGLRTVELRRANIMKKMRADSLADLVRMILSAGEMTAVTP